MNFKKFNTKSLLLNLLAWALLSVIYIMFAFILPEYKTVIFSLYAIFCFIIPFILQKEKEVKKKITLTTLHLATAQEVFDQVVEHLLNQNKRSFLSRRGCLYRFENLKCAAGCLIADEEYNEKFENNNWNSLIKYGLVNDNHHDLIRSLQIIHDDFEVYQWKKELIELAKTENLKFNYESN